MALGYFILQNLEEILLEWEQFAASLPPGAKMGRLALRDHAEEILRVVAEDMHSPQTESERQAKSQGRASKRLGAPDTAAETHATARLVDGFSLEEMVAEYRALRASVIRLWTRSLGAIDHSTLETLTRFNEAIDQAMTESISRYAARLDRSRDLLLGALGHDLRTPLGAMLLSAEYLLRSEGLDQHQLQAVARLRSSGARMKDMISDLLDLTRTRMGGELLPIAPTPMNLGSLCKHVIEEIEASHPGCTVRFEAAGDLSGTWDEARLGQALSNLLANAVKYGADHEPITIEARGEDERVVVSVHNEGPPIPEEEIRQIFDPFTRTARSRESKPADGLGLGLYIVQEIIRSHGGQVEVSSTEGQGTTFRVCLPRQPSWEVTPRAGGFQLQGAC